MASAIQRHFPFSKIRPGQLQALSLIEEAVAAGKRFIIIEAPTGVGKSGIAMAVARWAQTFEPADLHDQRGAYILSTQKTLTAQYMNDFSGELMCDECGGLGKLPCSNCNDSGINRSGENCRCEYKTCTVCYGNQSAPGLIEMRGRSNFQCVSGLAPNLSCEDGPDLDCEEGKEGGTCPYKLAKAQFASVTVGVTNFSYFLAETAYVGRLQRRNFLIIDECHNVERQLLDFWEVSLSRQRIQDFGMRAPDASNNHQGPVRVWLENSFFPMLIERVAQAQERARLMKPVNPAAAAGLYKKANALSILHQKLSEFVSSPPEDWFVFNERDGSLLFKRFSAAKIAEPMLFRKGQFVLMMSATILDTATFMRNLGINPKDAVTLQLPSEFPKENRPVIGWYAGNMNMANIDRTLPKLCASVEQILDQCATLKGIIHTHSYKVTRAVVDYLNNTKHRARVITHLPGDSESRERAIEMHRLANFASVLVSPSMAEGLDLKGDLARFQIICKVPYPSLDPYTTARKDHDPAWYLLQTGLTLIQASGRSVRSDTDWAYTFILDQGFHPFFCNNFSMFSPWWSNSVKVIKRDAVAPIFAELAARAKAS